MNQIKLAAGLIGVLLVLFLVFYVLNYFDILTVDSMDNWLQDIIAWFENVFEGPTEVIPEVVEEATT